MAGICNWCGTRYSEATCFQCAFRRLEEAIQNVDAYGSRLALAAVAPRPMAAHAGIQARGAAPEWQTFSAFVDASWTAELARERTFVDESRASLENQRDEMQLRMRGLPLPTSPANPYADFATLPHSQLRGSAGKGRGKLAVYHPIRNALKEKGFIVSPPGVALGAVFPPNDWIKSPPASMAALQQLTDELVQRHQLLGDDDEVPLTRKLATPNPPAGLSAGKWSSLKRTLMSVVGCVCVSWTRHKVGESIVLVPVLGISGITDVAPDADFFKRLCRHLGVPEAQLAKPTLAGGTLGAQASANYSAMIERTNLAAVSYRIRSKLRLRLPARQAILSYDSFMDIGGAESADLISALRALQPQDPQSPGVDLCLAFWHVLNCAEPAALVTAASVFCEGADVVVCFPYEGIAPTGPSRNRPKETCPWCAAVELGFRSPSSGVTAQSLATGQWPTQFNVSWPSQEPPLLPPGAAFDAFDPANVIMMAARRTITPSVNPPVKARDLQEVAYPEPIATKIGRVRSMYHLLGLLDPGAVAVDRPLFGFRANRIDAGGIARLARLRYLARQTA